METAISPSFSSRNLTRTMSWAKSHARHNGKIVEVWRAGDTFGAFYAGEHTLDELFGENHSIARPVCAVEPNGKEHS